MQPDRTEQLKRLLDERILVLDGATGTALQGYTLTAADFGGPELEGCNENLCRTYKHFYNRSKTAFPKQQCGK